MNSKFRRNAILIISMALIAVIYNLPITFHSLYPENDQANIIFQMEKTSYVDDSGLELSTIQEQNIISSVLELKFSRGKVPAFYHGDRTISFRLMSQDHKFNMYINLDICRPEWSIVVLDEKGYEIGEKDAIKLIQIFDENLPLDSNNSRCKY